MIINPKWLCLLVIGCSRPTYTVVSSFDEVILVTHDREKARETARTLTLEGRVLASKPQYHVKEK